MMHAVLRLCRGALAGLVLLGLVAGASSVHAQDTYKIALIEPLSGSFAIAGEEGVRHFEMFIDMINAEGGLNGTPIEFQAYDNQLSAKVAVEKVRQAIADGADMISQGNSSGIAHAITDAVNKYNQRNPGDEVLYFNYAAVDPALTNEDCNFWHFRWDANVDIKMRALISALKEAGGTQKVYLLSQDYSYGHAFSEAAKRELERQIPSAEVVGDEFHPIAKVKDFTPYISKIQASGADTLLTGNWGPDMTLLGKAAAQSGLDVRVVGYYVDYLGAPAALGEAGEGLLNVSEGNHNDSSLMDRHLYRTYMERTGDDYYYFRVQYMFDYLVQAAEDAGSLDPIPLAKALEGMERTYSRGRTFMRAEDHQIFMPIYVNEFTEDVKYTALNSDLGFRTFQAVPTEETMVSTTCEMERPS